MKCLAKVLSVNGVPASDGSIIPFDVMNDYLNSQECKESLEKHRMVGTLTHRSRNLQATLPELPALSKTVGKDDSIIIVSEKTPAPTHYVSKLYIDSGWLWAEITLLEEDGMDDIAIQNIRRLKGMLNNGILPGVSAVIVGYWDSQKTGTDILKKLVNLKGCDITLNPSWKAAGIEEIVEYGDEKKTEDDSDDYYERHYSDTEDYSFSGVKVKAFSDISSFGITAPKSSKIDGSFTKLCVKEFSSCGTVSELGSTVVEKSFSNESGEGEQKEFTQAQVRERLREIKMGPRVYLRRLYISYKQAVKSLGGVDKAKPEDIQILKSMFTSDILQVLNSITPEVVEKGKQINTLLGLSALSKTARVEGQKLQLPLRMAMKELQKNGFVSKMRYQKLQECYKDFIKGLQEDVFGANPEPIPAEDENMENIK